MPSDLLKEARCVKERSNWSYVKPQHRFDVSNFSSEFIKKDIDHSSPKLKKLIENIKELDEKDMQTHGKVFKHFIYSDISNSYGVKLIAAGLTAYGFEHAYKFENSTFKFVDKNTKFNTFATLTSSVFFKKPIGVRFKKELLRKYNERPDNIYGEKMRIIILDSGFREGVDLFDVKYVHIFEPLLTISDQKQTIGRATRFCGQSGLPFENGWKLNVFIYDSVFTPSMKEKLREYVKSLPSSNNVSDFVKELLDMDVSKLNFANQLETIATAAAIDYRLTKTIHNTNKRQVINTKLPASLMKYKWKPVKNENGCIVKESSGPLNFSSSQDFVRHYFTPDSNIKGLLLMHSVGTGKTCTAVATASTSFETNGYKILYVTRHTLKSDVVKNIFGSNSCHEGVRKETLSLKDRLPPSWFKVMSYKQFSNALLERNAFFKELKDHNGSEDILKKTLIIIDEAHKLNADDVSASERPDINIIKSMIHKSYEVSKQDSVKVLLMTATPYTSDPMDMIKLVNLLLPKSANFPEEFEDFKKKYLKADGSFDPKKLKEIQRFISPYISYLNRENDLRTFAIPKIERVQVHITNNKELQKELNLIETMDIKVKGAEYHVNNMKIYIEQTISEEIKKANESIRDIKSRSVDKDVCKERKQNCIHDKLTCENEFKTCMNQAKADGILIKELTKKLKRPYYKKYNEDIRHDVAVMKYDEAQLKLLKSKFKMQKAKVKTMKAADNSQHTHIIECLKKSAPAFSASAYESVKNDKKVLLIQGHGFEKFIPFERRQIVPKGKTLVIFPICGRYNWVDLTTRLMNIMKTPKHKHLFADPVANKPKIDKLLKFPIRIYEEGDRIPYMESNLFLTIKRSRSIDYLPSGVIDIDNIDQVKYKSFKDESEFTQQIFDDIYKDNVFDMSYKPYKQMEKNTYKILDILNNVGDGVYYYGGCRFISEREMKNIKDEEYSELYNKSVLQQKKFENMISPAI